MVTYIKKLVLKGFKSFNRKTSIPFCKGFNVICGPNGSGKSNILDAICFVLGTLSLKSLRASRLAELIFHGSTNKKPAEYASVTLYLDNSSKVFPYDDEEVTITRKINRRGVCVYKINGRNVTREKVLQLLSMAKLRPNGYNIILQGDVTRLIEMNPVERREIIDEIAGIKEYNEKKEKALRDLEAVQQKLREVEIIINQKKQIFEKLKKERDAALKFKELEKRLKILRASLIKKRKEECEKEKNKIEERISFLKDKLEKVEKDFKSVENELLEKEREIEKIAKKVFEVSKKVEIERKIADLKLELELKRNKIEVNKLEIERLDKLIDKLQALHERRVEELREMPRAVKAILKLNLRGVYGTISQLVKVPERLRTAIEVAAGPHWWDIVVENEDVASFCIEYLKRERIGRATFLPLNKIKPKLFKQYNLLSIDGVIGVASKLIKFDTRFLPAMEFVFGDTLIVKDLETAKTVGIGKIRMVTLDGDLIERSGAMTGGYLIKKPVELIKRDVERELEFYLEKRKDLKTEIALLESEIKDIEKELKKLAKSKLLKEYIDLEKVRIASEREIDRLRRKRFKLNEERIKLRSKINELQIEKARIEKGIETLKEREKEFEGIETLDWEVKKIEKEIRKSEIELARLGPVNLKAIEEFERFKEEFDKIKEKYEKVVEEREAVLRMIEEIEKKRKEVFMKTLTELSKHFNFVFNKMTGGFAELKLEDPENIESGLLIRANPAGKSLISIDAMSGGEKTLTALAFLFAIQKYKPTPFYVLDEVDAALDKENTKKVVEFIKELSKQAQFIVITHNDTTIKYADRLYGVSMVNGESKIVGLELP